MDTERDDDEEMNITVSVSLDMQLAISLRLAFQSAERASSIDSLEQYDLISGPNENLHLIRGCHQWVNQNAHVRVNNYRPSDFLVGTPVGKDFIGRKAFATGGYELMLKANFDSEEEEDNDESHLSHMDVSLNHFDVQLQVNHGQLQHATRYGVFSSVLNNLYPTEKISLFKTNQCSQTSEMDMDSGDGRHGRSSGYSQTRSTNDESQRRSRRDDKSSSNYGGGNGANPNRNNNNSRRYASISTACIKAPQSRIAFQ